MTDGLEEKRTSSVAEASMKLLALRLLTAIFIATGTLVETWVNRLCDRPSIIWFGEQC
jgi:hypothetical protein